MEYLAGSVITIMCMVIGYVYAKKSRKTILKGLAVRDSQSRKFQILSPLVQYTVNSIKKDLNTQATNYHDNIALRVVLYENKAYWIDSNKLYYADFADGKVDSDNKKIVDTISMNRVELDKVVYIVNKLTEGSKHENSDPGK